MTPLQRHQLVWLDALAWQRVLAASTEAAAWDTQALECLQHWAEQNLPLVVTRQPHGWSGHLADETLVLGVAAPLCWGRRRLFVEARVADVRQSGQFPYARDISALLPIQTLTDWTALCIALDSLGTVTRVYGSHGWQQLTGLACLRDGSDIDLLVAVDSPRQADAAVALLKRVSFSAPRLDGELVFAHHRAVAWREWAEWRAGGTTQLLVKNLRGASLEKGDAWAVAA
ncbi:MAG: malonate decarboxylase holo-[acyl-carrier-protein] synthase [Burkholderiaceae bacterium]